MYINLNLFGDFIIITSKMLKKNEFIKYMTLKPEKFSLNYKVSLISEFALVFLKQLF